MLLGRYHSAQRNYCCLFRRSELPADVQFNAGYQIALAHIRLGDTKLALQMIRKIRSAMDRRRSGSLVERRQLDLLEGWILWLNGDAAMSVSVTSKTLAALNRMQFRSRIRERLKIEKVKVDAYHNLGSVCYYQGRYSTAIRYYAQALAISRRRKDRQGIAASYNNLGIVYAEQGADRLATRYYERYIRIAVEIGYKQGIAIGWGNLGLVHANAGRYSLAQQTLTRSMRTARELGDKYQTSFIQSNLAAVHIQRGYWSKALACARTAEAIAKTIKDKFLLATSQLNMGRAFTLAGDHVRADRYVSRSLIQLRKLKDPYTLIDAYQALAEIATVKSRPDWIRARQYSRQALALAVKLRLSVKQADCLRQLGEIAAKRGEGHDAERYYRKALAISGRGADAVTRAHIYLSYARLLSRIAGGDVIALSKARAFARRSALLYRRIDWNHKVRECRSFIMSTARGYAAEN